MVAASAQRRSDRLIAQCTLQETPAYGARPRISSSVPLRSPPLLSPALSPAAACPALRNRSRSIFQFLSPISRPSAPAARLRSRSSCPGAPLIRSSSRLPSLRVSADPRRARDLATRSPRCNLLPRLTDPTPTHCPTLLLPARRVRSTISLNSSIAGADPLDHRTAPRFSPARRRLPSTAFPPRCAKTACFSIGRPKRTIQ